MASGVSTISTSLTLGELRQGIGLGLGEGRVVGTFSSVNASMAVDNQQFEADHYFQNAFIQDTAPSNGSITRVKDWTQLTSTYTLFGSFPITATTNDPYELSSKLSFPELRLAINQGITHAGKAINQTVRDESRTIAAASYQITPNYASGTTNAFWPGGVQEISYQYWTGQNTRDWIVIPKSTDGTGWYYLDSETCQLPQMVVDAMAGNPLRLSGYGPISAPITVDTPSLVVATFDDDYMAYVLKMACQFQAWSILAAKNAGGENSVVRTNMQMAYQNYMKCLENWKKPRATASRIILATGGAGWSRSR